MDQNGRIQTIYWWCSEGKKTEEICRYFFKCSVCSTWKTHSPVWIMVIISKTNCSNSLLLETQGRIFRSARNRCIADLTSIIVFDPMQVLFLPVSPVKTQKLILARRTICWLKMWKCEMMCSTPFSWSHIVICLIFLFFFWGFFLCCRL